MDQARDAPAGIDQSNGHVLALLHGVPLSASRRMDLCCEPRPTRLPDDPAQAISSVIWLFFAPIIP
ncbi:hypothetical protein ACE0DR_04215 [Azotobacter sp. CWF10]